MGGTKNDPVVPSTDGTYLRLGKFNVYYQINREMYCRCIWP